MFNNAQNLMIDGGVFTNIGGDFNQYNIHGSLLNSDGEQGLHTLSRVASLGATHDSSERYPPPSCHAETRLEVRQLILEWIEDRNKSSSILWLYGSAGVGKSAIIQSIAEELALQEVYLGATFFFSVGKPDRNQGRFLFPTIAYQLALSIPELRTHINNAMVSNPTLHTKSINVQLRHLIIEPFRKLAASPQLIPTILVDGLDECENHEIQRLIITLIGEALVIDKLPIRFVIASRPEAHIREVFDTIQLCNITNRIFLDQSFQASRDIEKYLEDGFRDIHDRNAQVMAQVARPWPEQGVIDLLVQRASGQFIYAATVLKFVGAEYYRPTSQLAIILEPMPSSASPFADLDHLYDQILSMHHDPHTLIRVLGTLLTLQGWQPPEVIEDILGMEAGDLTLTLRGLHSVIHFPQSQVDAYQGYGHSDEERGLRLFHASFHDYLVDRDRSGLFFVDKGSHREEVTFLAFELVGKWISLSWSSSREYRQSLRPRTWGYLRANLAVHFWQCCVESRHKFLDIIRTHIEGFGTQSLNSLIQFTPLYCASSNIDFQKLCLQHSEEADKDLDQKLIDTSKVFRSIIDRCYDLVLSRSSELSSFLDSVPGFILLETPMELSDMAEVLSVDVGILEAHLARNQSFLFSAKSGVMLDNHLVAYLFDKGRSGHHYHDQSRDYVFLCKRGLSLSVEYWRDFEDCKMNTQDFYRSNLTHLINEFGSLPLAPSDPFLSTFVEYLEDFHWPAGLQGANLVTSQHIWACAIEVISWAQGQQQKAIQGCTSVNFERKLNDIMNRILLGILYVECTSEGPVITVRPPLITLRKQNYPWTVYMSSENLELSLPTLKEARGAMRISRQIRFLEADVSNPVLELYFTNPQRAQGVYLSKDDFHTQLVEIWLDECWDQTNDSEYTRTFYQRMEDHIIQAKGSDRIFALLRVLDYELYTASERDSRLRNIITWLETLDKPPLDIYLRYQLMLLEAEEGIKKIEEEEMRDQSMLLKAEEDIERVEEEMRNNGDAVPSHFVDIQKFEENPLDTTTPAFPIAKPSWKRAFEGIGDGYLWLVLLLLDYCSVIFYRRRRC